MGAAGAGACYALLAPRPEKARVHSRGRASSKAVALLFDSSPNRFTPQLCRWLHDRHLSAAFFLREDVTSTARGLSQLRPFEVGVTYPRARRPGPIGMPLSVAQTMRGRGSVFSLVERSISPKKDARLTYVRPSKTLVIGKGDWSAEVADLVSSLRGGEFILIKLPEEDGEEVNPIPFLEALYHALATGGFRIWGLNALLRGYDAR